jgi:hypothetical protein
MRSKQFFAGLGRLLAGSGSLVLMGLLVASGCNSAPPEGEVTGTVRVKGGGPLPAGEVTFVDENGTRWTRAIGPTGGYRVPGLPLGPKKIVVQSMAPGKAVSNAFGTKDKRTAPTPVLKIHKRYINAKTTDLEYTVRKGEQTYDIELDGP